AVFCPASATVWIADWHLGKEQTFRRAGIPVPDLLTRDLSQLTRVLHTTAARQLYVLGDLLHARTGQCQRLTDAVAAWRDKHQSVSMTLVRGNHDQHAGDPPTDWQFDCVNAPMPCGPLTLTHHPLFDERTFNLAGHLHPKWRGRSRAEDLKLPCFLLRRRSLVLPAFGHFIDHGVIAPQASDHIYVVADGHCRCVQA
ncbi:MAG TPA: ligase-associated DNA damage response endonuclease PdeM, partial [Planctomycetaceae bacterium]|nr:ligase-associated DNA damage response endonuclease PdeM [Planctomycetaceae bacterium]